MMLLLLAQLAIWEVVKPPVLHQGWWQSCQAEERVLEHRVAGHLQWELHLGPADQFALYAFKVDGPDHSHEDSLNLLGTPHHDDLKTWTGGRQWTVPSLRLWLSIVRAGGDVGCDAFYIRIETK
jgi:hypothetical protein